MRSCTTMRAGTVAAVAIAALSLATLASGQGTVIVADATENGETLRARLAAAQRNAAAAEARGRELETEARAATEAAEKTAREAAALAARIQQAEAGIDAAEARIALVGQARDALDLRLAERREPLVRLTGALQKLARRPVALSVLRPGTLRETVYLRALLDSTVPQVRARTAALRSEIERGRALEREARQALATLESTETTLAERRKRLATLETRQRLASRRTGGAADRENERALALAEEAGDLDSLVDSIDAVGALREELAALPGPMLRPARIDARADTSAGRQTSNTTAPRQQDGTPPPAFRLPVIGRTLAGFGTRDASGVVNTGLALRPSDGAQVVAPAAGRVAFSGPYRGYDRIVILEHDGALTSLVTGLARADVAVGDELVAGAPLGVAGTGDPTVTLEIRRDGRPVDPLRYVR
ncbi:MAG: peptidoglycan DD-metalloendopeptidase family protein [Parerythrobacter sp.]